MSGKKEATGTASPRVELTLIGIGVAVVLTLVLAMANAYLALKVGILTSASIPAAVLSMSILKLFRRNYILENNLIQTAASAGEAIAGGIVYTIPALIIIRYWDHFGYLENVMIALVGGVLGVLFSVPIRKLLVHEKTLPFPEGRAVAEVLKASQAGSIVELVKGGIAGALLELCQLGFKVIANSYQIWFAFRRMIFGFGVGFSATLIGAGYLIGFEITLSIFIGAIIGWVLAIPVSSLWHPGLVINHLPKDAVMTIWNAKIRYIGIGAMLASGVLTFTMMLKPLVRSIRASYQEFRERHKTSSKIDRQEQDIPMPVILLLTSLFSAIMFVLFIHLFPLNELGFPLNIGPTFVFASVLYVLLVGFVFSVITGYFSGLIGVSASPGSSVIIAGMLLCAFILFHFLSYYTPHLTAHQIHQAEAVTIIIGSVITGIAAIANDNIQDLKVGQLVGATPWRQQVMLFLGVAISSLVIPPVMQLLFDVYGIAGVLPHPHMDPSQSLPAPPAAMMAAITQAVFHHGLPWAMLGLGMLITLILLPITYLLERRFQLKLSSLGVAIGIYLPMASSIPLFIGGLVAFATRRALNASKGKQQEREVRAHRGLLLACGLVAGAALMDVLLAIPFSIARNPDVIKMSELIFNGSGIVFAVISTAGLCYWFYHTVCHKQ